MRGANATLEEFRQDNAKLLKIWEEAKGYGWKLDEGKNISEFFQNPGSGISIGKKEVMLYTIRPPTKEDPRNNWAAVWCKVPVVSHGGRYYINFPHWLEDEIARERTLLERTKKCLGSVAEDYDRLWSLAWTRFASTGEGFKE